MYTSGKAVSTIHVTACTVLGHLGLFIACYMISWVSVDTPVVAQLSVRMQPFVASALNEIVVTSKPPHVAELPAEESENEEPRKEVSRTEHQPFPAKQAQRSAAPKPTAQKATAKEICKALPAKSKGVPSKKETVLQDCKAQVDRKAKLLASARKSMAHMQKQTGTSLPVHQELSLPASLELISQPSDFSFSPPTYAEEIAIILKHSLNLPERVEVEMALTIARSGKVLHVDFGTLESPSTKYVDAHIKTLSFPPFGKLFPGEAEHTFSIKLSME